MTYDRGSNSSDASTSQGMPRIAGKHQKPEEARRILPYSFHSEHGPANNLILDFWPPEL